MSEDAGAVPTPWVVDVSVLAAVARGDYGVMSFIQHVDAGGRTLVIPALALAGASLDMRGEDAELILQGLHRGPTSRISAGPADGKRLSPA